MLSPQTRDLLHASLEDTKIGSLITLYLRAFLFPSTSEIWEAIYKLIYNKLETETIIDILPKCCMALPC